MRRFGKFVPIHVIRSRLRGRFGKFKRVSHGCKSKSKD